MSFEDFLKSLQKLGGAVQIDPAEEQAIRSKAATIEALPAIDAKVIEALISSAPDMVPVLGLSAGLTKERLKNFLRFHFGTTSVRIVVRDNCKELVGLLDAEFALFAELEKQRKRSWSFADILIERDSTRLRAAGSISRGRHVEDQVEAIVQALGLPYEMRTRFEGRSGRTAPCDLAIPKGGASARIVVGAKGFDSTGSKLTDAAREVEEMADVRLPRQFVLVVADGIGWLNRQSDLVRIYRAFESGAIDGLYNLSGLERFRKELRADAQRLGLLPPD